MSRHFAFMRINTIHLSTALPNVAVNVMVNISKKPHDRRKVVTIEAVNTIIDTAPRRTRTMNNWAWGRNRGLQKSGAVGVFQLSRPLPTEHKATLDSAFLNSVCLNSVESRKALLRKGRWWIPASPSSPKFLADPAARGLA